MILCMPFFSGCTKHAGNLIGWDGDKINFASPVNLGTESVFGISWCTAPDRVCQKSLPQAELKPGKTPSGGGYSVFPDKKVRVPSKMEVSWFSADGLMHQQMVELSIPENKEVIRRYGAPGSSWDRLWGIVLIFNDGLVSYAWLLQDTSDMGYRKRKFTPAKALVYDGNLEILKGMLEPGEANTIVRYDPE